MDSSDKYIGQFLDNRYEILEKIGSGGMAVVYKARCHRLNRFVAVKILKDDLANDEDFRRRFRTEAEAVAMLSHTNIVSIYDVSRSGSVEYIVMELIEGITLKQYINRKGLLNWKESLHFATQITKALIHAHSRGIIHRDIKPHNIIILKDGSVKVTDFGIARLLYSQNTLTQEALGSVHYISPEQAKGSPVDSRSDIYSVGVVLYEMLTSRLPFVGDSPVSVAIQHISAIPLMPREINPDIPLGLESITMHAMDPDLNSRYASAESLLYDLEEFRKNPAIDFNYSLFRSPVVADANGQNRQDIPLSGTVIDKPPVKPVPRVSRTSPRREPTNDEYRRNRRTAGKTSTLVAVFCIIIFIIGAAVFMWKYILEDMLNPKPTYVNIPTFQGKLYSSIVDDPLYDIYNFIVTNEYSDLYEKDIIISQNPNFNVQKAIPESGVIDISLTVSLGKLPTDTMINIINRERRDARLLLESMNLDLKIVETAEASNDVTEGYVTRQFPEEGANLAPGSSVYIFYSSGPNVNKVRVPDVVGETGKDAAFRLEVLKFSVESIFVFSDKPEGTVLAIDPAAGTEVDEYSKVTLTIAKAPEVTTPPPTPSDTTPPPTPTDTTPPPTPSDTTPPPTPTDTAPPPTETT